MIVIDRFMFADKICDILEIENVNIMKIEILIKPQDIVEVIIHKVMTEKEGAKIITEMEKRNIPNGTNKTE